MVLFCWSNYCLFPDQVPDKPSDELLQVPLPELPLSVPWKVAPDEVVPKVA